MSKAKDKPELLQITQIKIKLSDKREIELTTSEARQIFEELEKLFKLEDKTKAERNDEILHELQKLNKENPPYIPYPVYIDRYPLAPSWDRWTVTCSNYETTNAINGNSSLSIKL